MIGAGQMGNGIAHVWRSPATTSLIDDVEPTGRTALATIHATWPGRSRKGVITEADRGRRCSGSGRAGSERFGDCDLVIEAATENEAVKRKIFGELCPQSEAEALIAHQHLVDLDHPACLRHRPARALHRHSLHEPGAGDEAGRGHPRHRDRRRDLRGGARVRESLGKTVPVPRTSRPSSSTASCCR